MDAVGDSRTVERSSLLYTVGEACHFGVRLFVKKCTAKKKVLSISARDFQAQPIPMCLFSTSNATV